MWFYTEGSAVMPLNYCCHRKNTISCDRPLLGLESGENGKVKWSQGDFSVLSWVSLQYHVSKTVPFPLEIPSIFSEPRGLFSVLGLFQKGPPLKRKQKGKREKSSNSRKKPGIGAKKLTADMFLTPKALQETCFSLVLRIGGMNFLL